MLIKINTYIFRVAQARNTNEKYFLVIQLLNDNFKLYIYYNFY